MLQHLECKELSMLPTQNHMKIQKEILQKRADIRMENVFKTKQMNNSASVNLDIPIS